MIGKFRIVLILVFLLVISHSAFAQNPSASVWDQIQDAYELAILDNYKVSSYTISSTTASDMQVWTLDFEKDKSYLIRGFCDENCKDLDLSLQDNFGSTVKYDYENDDYPFFTLIPKHSGQYQIEIYMQDCSTESCYWGLAIFEQ